MNENRFQACASCIHFFTEKNDTGMLYKCTRLGYETRPEYKFNCWEPKEKVKKLMEKEKGR